MLGLTLISALGYYLTVHIGDKILKTKTKKLLSDSCLTIIAAFCQMGVTANFNSTSTKLIMVKFCA